MSVGFYILELIGSPKSKWDSWSEGDISNEKEFSEIKPAFFMASRYEGPLVTPSSGLR